MDSTNSNDDLLGVKHICFFVNVLFVVIELEAHVQNPCSLLCFKTWYALLEVKLKDLVDSGKEYVLISDDGRSH